MTIKMSKKKNQSGFTLVEMIVVIAIIGILASILTVAVMSYVEEARNATDAENARIIANALNAAQATDGDKMINTDTPWGEDPANINHGYVYIDDDEIRVNSMEIARILEKNGILKEGSCENATYRAGVEPQFLFSNDQVNILCKSTDTWNRYQICFVRQGNKIVFSYLAASDNNNRDNDATEDLADRAGGSAAPSYIIMGGRD